LRFHHIIAAVWLALTCAAAPAHAEKRVALVIGNAAYRYADRLANPVNDAQGVRDALTKLKFDVIYGADLDLKGLQEAIGRFAGVIRDADVAVVYFAGHGVTFVDTPYVVPVDAKFSSLEGVRYELVPVETLIGELREVKNGVRIVILDACRDNAAERELKRQAVAARGGEITRGLGPLKNPSGLIIAYATGYMSTAADGGAGLFSWGSAQHSPFTAALLSNTATQGLDVTDMLRKVGREVAAATDGKQRPEIAISMYEQYALAPAAAGAGSAGVAPAPQPPAGPAADEVTWNFLKDTRDAELLRRFIAQYPASPRRREAEERLKVLEQVAVAAPPVTPAVPAGGPCGGLTTVSLASHKAAPLSAAEECSLKPKDSFRECADCPEMVVAPAGSFTMGSPANEKERFDDEGPQHAVTIGRPFAVGKTHVTVDQFRVFATERGYSAHSGCDWRNPGFRQDGSHPVVCVSWDDANAYAQWLAQKTGKSYRLPSEAEWEYAARAGTTAPFWWGSSITPAQANYDGTYVYAGGGSKGEYRQGTVPGDSFKPNPWGLYNVHGNALQWTADCWHKNYTGAPADGSAWTAACDGNPVWFAAVPGPSFRGSCAPPTASGTLMGASTSASVRPGRLPLNLYVFTSLIRFLPSLSRGSRGRQPPGV
jgi:formylglycine-generating enzyme required for sulfatase activity